MGAGGAIFMHEGKQGTNPTDVASGGINLSLINVTLKDNAAQGGNGGGGSFTRFGGGGMGGNGHTDGAAGGVLGSAVGYQYGGCVTDATFSARGTNGGIPIFGSGGKEGSPSDAGFGGGGGGGTTGAGASGRGGFGGGGGNAGTDNNFLNNGGARGGFGGGGGGLENRGNGSNGSAGNDDGQGGFGTGNGTTIGGGGMGAGGAIFVTSGTLSLQNVSFQNNMATGGAGGNPGKGLGGALFVFDKADNGSNAAPGTTNDPQVTGCGVTFSGNIAADDTGTPTNNDNMYGNFRTQHQLTTSASAGGTISPPSGCYDEGNVEITATADVGYTFTGFTGALTGATNPQTLNLTGPASVTANFTAICPTITATVSGGGAICPGGSSTVTVTLTGGTAPYTVTLNNGGGTLTGNSPLNFAVSPASATTYTVSSATDANNCPATASGSAIVTPDNIAPTLTLKPNLTLWSPNHSYSTVTMSQMVQSVSDNCSSLFVNDVVIEKVTSDEPDNVKGNGDGETINDIVIAANCKSVQLRAERDGNKNGRVYVVKLRVSDASGNKAWANFKVRVPLSQNGNPAVEDPAVLFRTSNCPCNCP